MTDKELKAMVYGGIACQPNEIFLTLLMMHGKDICFPKYISDSWFWSLN